MKEFMLSKELLKLYVGGFLEEEDEAVIDVLVEEKEDWKALYREVEQELLQEAIGDQDPQTYVAELHDRWKKKIVSIESDGSSDKTVEAPKTILPLWSIYTIVGVAAAILIFLLIFPPFFGNQDFDPYSDPLLASSNLSQSPLQVRSGSTESKNLVREWINEENYDAIIDSLEGLPRSIQQDTVYSLLDLALAYLEADTPKQNIPEGTAILEWIEKEGYQAIKNDDSRERLLLPVRAKLAQVAGQKGEKELEKMWLNQIIEEKPPGFEQKAFHDFVKRWYATL
ncbi:MAG: hypothetical protein AAF135_24160 [Bacteroidota bacterium]